MKKMLLGFVLGLLVGAGGYWYLNDMQGNRTLRVARAKAVIGADRVRTAVEDAVGEFKTDVIKDELARTGMVVREKAKKASAAISDAAANARTTATIKAKLIADPKLSALSVNVDTTDGLVTLSGTVGSHEEVAKAVRIALETDGVTKVVSTLQVKPAK